MAAPAASLEKVSAEPAELKDAGPKWVGPSRAQVGGPRIHRFGSLGIEVGKSRFSNCPADNRSKVSVKNLKSGSSLLTFRDLSSHICEIFLWMAKSGILDLGKTGFFKTHFFCEFLKNRTRTFFKNLKFPKNHVPTIQKNVHIKLNLDS